MLNPQLLQLLKINSGRTRQYLQQLRHKTLSQRPVKHLAAIQLTDHIGIHLRILAGMKLSISAAKSDHMQAQCLALPLRYHQTCCMRRCMQADQYRKGQNKRTAWLSPTESALSQNCCYDDLSVATRHRVTDRYSHQAAQ